MTMQQQVKELVASVLQKAEAAGGLKSVYLVACGGSYAGLYPARYFLDAESTCLRVAQYTSNEFVHVVPKGLGPNSLVVTCSFSGATPETAEAGRVGLEHGAQVTALTAREDSPVARNSSRQIFFGLGQEARPSSSSICTALRLAAELVQQTEGFPCYAAFQDALEDKIDMAVSRARAHVTRRMEKLAQKYQDESLYYVVGSGASWGAAYCQAICMFMEMGWLQSSAVHSGEYFHGPFEVTDQETPFLLLLSEGRTRPLDERAQRFLEKFSKKLIVLDAKELGVSVIDKSVAEYFCPVVFGEAARVFSEELAKVRKHPLNIRRYMWQMEY